MTDTGLSFTKESYIIGLGIEVCGHYMHEYRNEKDYEKHSHGASYQEKNEVLHKLIHVEAQNISSVNINRDATYKWFVANIFTNIIDLFTRPYLTSKLSDIAEVHNTFWGDTGKFTLKEQGNFVVMDAFSKDVKQVSDSQFFINPLIHDISIEGSLLPNINIGKFVYKVAESYKSYITSNVFKLLKEHANHPIHDLNMLLKNNKPIKILFEGESIIFEKSLEENGVTVSNYSIQSGFGVNVVFPKELVESARTKRQYDDMSKDQLIMHIKRLDAYTTSLEEDLVKVASQTICNTGINIGEAWKSIKENLN